MSRPERTAPPDGATEIMERAARGEAPAIERMPEPAVRIQLPMRDGVRLDTSVWLPTGVEGPVPAILLRTPYREDVLGWARLGVLRYCDAGYALVFQMIRGIGRSEGTFSFNAPHERTDGYDTVEWIASQSWCDGNVGMDGGSYLGMTQLAAATERPPHLRCMIPAVPSVDFFREIPYSGGGFTRQHTLTWTHLISAESLAELSGGFGGALPLLANATWFRRLSARPALAAADDLLRGDKLAHYRDTLAHPTIDAWWRERMLGPADWARIEIPTLLVSGTFDLSIGALTAWSGLEAHGPSDAERLLLIGPWDHSGTYVGGRPSYGPHELADWDAVVPAAIRLAFFDRHLRNRGTGPELGGRVKVYLTGGGGWRSFDAFPPREVAAYTLYLASEGRANSCRGDGRLHDAPVGTAQSPDVIVDDPEIPFVAPMTQAAQRLLDLRERGNHAETVYYTTGPLAAPLTILGEAEAVLFTAADCPDADLAVWLAEARPDGSLVQLAFGHLRLRYREGFDREVLLEPGAVVGARIRLHYVGHRLAAGHALVLLVSGNNYPWVDPNPHTGEPIATAVERQVARQTVCHGPEFPSRVVLPILLGSQSPG